DLVLKKKRAELYRCPIDRLELVYLQGFGISVSVDGQVKLAGKDVPVIFAPPAGNPVAVVNPIETAKSALRRLQALRRDDPDVLGAGLSMIAAKVANQAAVLKYFAKYRRRTVPDLARSLGEAAEQIRNLSDAVRTLDAGAAAVRGSAMGLEGRAAALYWKQVGQLVPDELSRKPRRAASPPPSGPWPGRDPPGLTDASSASPIRSPRYSEARP
ncbi:MAG: CRISPR-associated endonuclease Cas1, partial [Deltaproteobacteria bacterium]|nr:CRISPR-associated endonuclease Cas1 [Deltaproteobacteria bacterium]